MNKAYDYIHDGAAIYERSFAIIRAEADDPDIAHTLDGDIELPPIVETDEWCEFAGADADAYRRAVESGNFSAMRRASWGESVASTR